MTWRKWLPCLLAGIVGFGLIGLGLSQAWRDGHRAQEKAMQHCFEDPSCDYARLQAYQDWLAQQQGLGPGFGPFMAGFIFLLSSIILAIVAEAREAVS